MSRFPGNFAIVVAITVASVVLLFAVVWFLEAPRAPGPKDVEKIRAAFNRGDCQAIYRDTTSDFRYKVGQAIWLDECQGIRRKLRAWTRLKVIAVNGWTTRAIADTSDGLTSITIAWNWEEGQNRVDTLLFLSPSGVAAIPEMPGFGPRILDQPMDSPMPGGSRELQPQLARR